MGWTFYDKVAVSDSGAPRARPPRVGFAGRATIYKWDGSDLPRAANGRKNRFKAPSYAAVINDLSVLGYDAAILGEHPGYCAAIDAGALSPVHITNAIKACLPVLQGLRANSAVHEFTDWGGEVGCPINAIADTGNHQRFVAIFA